LKIFFTVIVFSVWQYSSHFTIQSSCFLAC